MKKKRAEAPRTVAQATRAVARVEQRTAIRYPSLAAGAVGFALLASGCRAAPDAVPGATLTPLGAGADTGKPDAPPTLALPGAGGWGSLAAGGGAGTPSADPGADAGAMPCDPDAGATPCEPNDLTADLDGGVDAGGHVLPAPHHPQPRGGARMVRPPGAAPRVTPEMDL